MALRLQSSSGGAERPNNSDQEKVAAFSVVRKKTPFQKHREEEEAKKKRADEEAARLYEEFVESFKADDLPGSKTFVRGGVINPDERAKPSATSSTTTTERSREKEKEKSSTSQSTGTKESVPTKKSGSRYVPSFIPPGLAAIVNKDKESDKKKDEEKSKEKDRGGKPRNIDNFMEELKKEQEMREKRYQEREHRREGRSRGTTTPPSRFDELPDDIEGKLPGSFDDGDPQTTNLYVGNLSPQVDENFLLRTFGRFGPIASVKIMWPRTEEERRRQRNCGFVAFMNRPEAQAAKDEMQGVVVYEYELRIGWGKAVALPAQALPAPPPGQMAIRSKEGGSTADVAWSGPGAPPATAVNAQSSEVVLTPNVPDIEVVPPSDSHLRHLIDSMAMYVLDDGCAFEQAVMKRGRGNPLFDFLFDLGSPEHTYYIWRLYSFAQGDTLQRWRTEPFIMVTGSGRWIPPALPQQDATRSPEHERALASASGRAKESLERALTDSQRDEFEDMLRALTLERNQIRDAMGFALDNSEASGEVVDVLTESLTIKETAIPMKVARLMLVSDILHNSSAPVKNASSYRTNFEARLPDIMESFNDLFRNVTGRITAEALKERVLKVLQVWADWFLFSDAYVNGLRVTFLRSGTSGVPSFHALCGDAPLAGVDEDDLEEARIDETTLAISQGEAAAELMSLPDIEVERMCRHNGLCVRGGKAVMVARLLNLEEVEKQRTGSGRNEFQKAARQRLPETADVIRKTKTALPASKWSREDSDDDDRNDSRMDYLSTDDVYDKRSDGDRRIDEEKRQKLRKLEVSLMEFRDTLEERGVRSTEEVEKKVLQQRRKLEHDYGLEPRSTDGRSERRESSRKRNRSRSRSSSPSRGRDRSRERERDSSRDRDRRRSRRN